MSQLIEILKKHGREPASNLDLMRAFSEGCRVFRFHDMEDPETDEGTEIHSIVDLMLPGYAYDQYVMISPEHIPEDLQVRKEKRFYVSMQTGKILADGQPECFLLAGPFLSHDKALTLVDKVREIACQADGKNWFNSFGTTAYTVRASAHFIGPLTSALGVKPEGV